MKTTKGKQAKDKTASFRITPELKVRIDRVAEAMSAGGKSYVASDVCRECIVRYLPALEETARREEQTRAQELEALLGSHAASHAETNHTPQPPHPRVSSRKRTKS